MNLLPSSLQFERSSIVMVRMPSKGCSAAFPGFTLSARRMRSHTGWIWTGRKNWVTVEEGKSAREANNYLSHDRRQFVSRHPPVRIKVPLKDTKAVQINSDHSLHTAARNQAKRGSYFTSMLGQRSASPRMPASVTLVSPRSIFHCASAPDKN